MKGCVAAVVEESSTHKKQRGRGGLSWLYVVVDSKPGVETVQGLFKTVLPPLLMCSSLYIRNVILHNFRYKEVRYY